MEFFPRKIFTFQVEGRVTRACAERKVGLEEARGLCLDRDAWRGVTDRIL